ncbi:MAG: hypothetical protein JST01_01885 [Cyanobacteria bacterium SZAS TMP-1]|nr:hypothetical protein [Cyanobacteria bacterium SZAS TMP-1]
MQTFNKKIILLCFALPLIAVFSVQLLRHYSATFSGGYFDQPGMGWVILFTCIMGGLSGAIASLLYIAIFAIRNKQPFGVIFIVIGIALAIPLARFQSNETGNERDHLIHLIAYYLFYSLIADSSLSSDDPLPPTSNLCIAPLTHLEIVNSNGGNFGITTGKGLRRTYTWEGASRSITMVPIGNKLLVYPEKSRIIRWPGFDWKIHNGIARCWSIEQVLDFTTRDQALEWLRKEKGEGLPFVYRNDGLVILWSKHIEPDTLAVMVYQLLINGRKPTDLPGAEDNKVIESKTE